MTKLLTAAQMRQAEQAAIESGAVTGLGLMERAGRGVVEAVFAEWPEVAATSHTAVVLCGPGNNGGDGFVVARLLKEWGWEVVVFLYGDAEKLPPDAKVNYERWCELGTVHDAAQFHDVEKDLHPDLVVDALFGTGLTRPVSDPVLWERLWFFDDCLDAWAMRDAGQPGPLVPPRSVAIDVSSGLDADSGRVLGVAEHGRTCARAMLTVTFHSPKLGHVLADGPEHCGKLVVHDIGLEPDKDGAALVEQPTPGQLQKWSGHKFYHGHALILGGELGRTGAARLAARGALRVGAGLVTLAAPEDAMPEIAAQVTAVMARPIERPRDLGEVLLDARLNAVCLGPGLGLERARDMVPAACGARPIRPTVLDADALTGFADDPDRFFGLLHPSCVLTPHHGEFAKLFPDIAEAFVWPATEGPAMSKVDATRQAAERAGCVVLFKGPDTVIASPDGRCAVHSSDYDRAVPWLATAGAGDVLAGIITGLLARGLDPFKAAETGAWLHVGCARAFGPGLIAEDLPEMLPNVFRQLGL